MLRNYEDKMLRVHEDKVKKNRYFVIASGPSLLKEDVEKLKNEKVIVINDNYLLAPFAKALYFCDEKWYNWHKEKPEFRAFQGQKYSQNKSWTHQEEAKQDGVIFLDSEPETGLSTNPEKLHQGSNSGIQAINLAYHLGAREIILLGYDMQPTGGKSHWFGDHPDKVVSNWYSWSSFNISCCTRPC